MFPDSDTPPAAENAPVSPALPKWPFVLGDLILLGAGLALWATQSPLTSLQTVLALGALGLGAVLFVLPFVMEFMTRTQLRSLELEQARVEDYQRLAALDAETRKQARTAMEAQEHAARATAALENLARKLDARLAPLESTQKALESAVAQLQETITDQATQQESEGERRQAAADKLAATTTTLTAALKRLDALADQPPPGPDPATVATLETIHERLEIMAHLLAQFRLPEPDLDLPPTPAAKEKAPLAGGSLLEKALSSNQPADESSAVSRIIESRPRKPRKPKAPAPSAEDISPPLPAAESSSDAPVAPAETDSSTDDLVESLAEPDASEELPDPETLFETPGESIEPIDAPLDDEVESPPAPSAEPAAVEATPEEPPPAAQPELLDPGAETTRKRRAAKSPRAGATLVARVLIGIGNKPYVRGEGPGLSPDKGVPMEFVEIGQWRWVAPANAADPIRVTIYKNDEVAAEGGPIVLHPGETLEVNPAFPS